VVYSTKKHRYLPYCILLPGLSVKIENMRVVMKKFVAARFRFSSLETGTRNQAGGEDYGKIGSTI
jgi:hypothetical protein